MHVFLYHACVPVPCMCSCHHTYTGSGASSKRQKLKLVNDPANADVDVDATLVACAFRKQRVYLFSRREPEDGDEQGLGRCGRVAACC